MNTATMPLTAATSDYTCSITAPISAKDALDKIARVSEWWAKNFEGSARARGDTFTVRFGDVASIRSGGGTFVDFKISEVMPDHRVVWLVTACHLPWLKDKTEWNGTRVVWHLSTSNGTTTIRMTHEGLTPTVECYGACEQGWNGHIQKSLRQLLEGGTGTPQ